ncbi:MAG TPA: LLM class F420-dependent oxidoreductase [Acidimicrobiales bacterium]|nr:LLM class F420-dependent oxidoreductase [Acidimicrobiales bacterium]HLN42870.1 LLM class F420-dependent oxidoreductase [Acidimicrobiales bacterium]
MRLSTMLDYSRGIKASADHVADLERAGLDIVWVAEAYGLDGPSQMGYIAARTERVEIGSAILPIYSRTPVLLAQTAAGIDALSDGRFILGLGASGPQVIEGWHGVPYTQPLERTREIIGICRKVWRREVVTNDGLYPIPLPPGLGTGLGKPLKLINHPVREEIPIWVASMGPKNVEMTAELADGWFPFLFIPERARQVWGDALDAGSARRSPDLGPLEIAAGGLVAIGEGLEGLRELARPMTALYVGGMGARGRNFYNALTRRYGFEAEAARIQDLYLSGKKEEAAAAVPDELLELTSLVGPPGYVQERVAAYREAGVSVLNVTPVGPDPLATLEQLKEWCS